MKLSADLWVMFRPAEAFQELAKECGGGRGTAVRRPLLLILVLACFASLAMSGGLSLRLLMGSAECALFVPLLLIASLALIRRPTVPFARAIDLFFTGHGPWTLWIISLAFLWAFMPAVKAFEWMPYRSVAYLAAAMAFAWSCYIDFWFLRRVFQRTPLQALRDLTVQRTLTWTAGLAIFVGPAAWQVIAGKLGW